MPDAREVSRMKYTTPTVELLLLSVEDILTVSDPYGSDVEWDEIAL